MRLLPHAVPATSPPPESPPLRRTHSMPALSAPDWTVAEKPRPASMPQMQRALLAQMHQIATGEVPGKSSERQRALHLRLLDEATDQALKFAEAASARDAAPGIYAMRGNTAVGKSRFSTTAMPALGDALAAAGGGCVNPDLFKVPLRAHAHVPLTSLQVHAESCGLADALEARLRDMKTADGAPASMLIDKRLSYNGEIGRYSALAQQTGRKLTLCDIDTDLEKSLVGVLERSPGGADPLPPFLVVGAGFSAARSQRLAVIDRFLADPGLGCYQLHGTAPNGDKIQLASVEHGVLTIHDRELYAAVTSAPGDAVARISEQVIDAGRIAELTGALGPQHQPVAAAALQPYLGMSWQQALDTHSQLAS